MCNRRIERDIPSDNRENKNFNMGLLNLGNEKMGDGINIIIYVIVAICIMMLFKWMKQCYTRRQEKMIRQMQLVQMKMQPLQPLQVPALAAPVACSPTNLQEPVQTSIKL